MNWRIFEKKEATVVLTGLLLSAFLVLGLEGSAFAAHPLITDDAGTQGKGKFEFELNGQYGYDKGGGTVQHTTPTATSLTYGATDSIDVSIGIPYQFIWTKNSGTTSHHDGVSDVSFSVKWRFHEKDGLSLVLKPGLTFPTGDKDKQLGTGKITYSLFFIATKEMRPWAFHLNLGYIGNENKLDQRLALWHASLASEYEVTKNLKAVANIGIQRNTDKASSSDPAFLLGGLIYSITENVDIDAGYKYGLTKPEVDHAVLAGITFRF
jgi:opacity protein-like surface antigen